MHAKYSLRYTESIANEVICSFSSKLGANLFTVATRNSIATRNGIVLAINSLANNSIVHVTRQEHEQFEALLEEYFNTSDVSDDEVGSDAKMECSKITMLIQ